jgi:hypothetical protein
VLEGRVIRLMNAMTLSVRALSDASILTVLGLVASLAGCDRKDAPAPSEPAVAAPALASPPAAPPVAIEVPAAPPPAATCTKALRVGAVRSSGGTTNSGLPSGSTGTLYLPCNGAGPARVVVNKQTLTGSVDASGNVNVAQTGTFKFANCPWSSRQTISGKAPNLSFRYTEKALPSCRTTARPTTLNGSVVAL